MRKGMMKGSGKRGYHNIIGKDPMVHSQSAKGIKQPQVISMKKIGMKRCDHVFDDAVGYGLHCVKCGFQPEKKSYQPSPMKDQELAKIIRNLDPFMQMMFNQQLANGVPPKKALEVVVNSVEGDRSQLSPELAEYAEKQGWLDSDGDGVPDSKDCQPLNPNKQGKKESITVNGKKLTIDYTGNKDAVDGGYLYYNGKKLLSDDGWVVYTGYGVDEALTKAEQGIKQGIYYID